MWDICVSIRYLFADECRSASVCMHRIRCLCVSVHLSSLRGMFPKSCIPTWVLQTTQIFTFHLPTTPKGVSLWAHVWSPAHSLSEMKRDYTAYTAVFVQAYMDNILLRKTEKKRTIDFKIMDISILCQLSFLIFLFLFNMT